MIRHLVDAHDKPTPAILEIPSKDHPYDPSKDGILRRARVSKKFSICSKFFQLHQILLVDCCLINSFSTGNVQRRRFPLDSKLQVTRRHSVSRVFLEQNTYLQRKCPYLNCVYKIVVFEQSLVMKSTCNKCVF